MHACWLVLGIGATVWGSWTLLENAGDMARRVVFKGLGDVGGEVCVKKERCGEMLLVMLRDSLLRYWYRDWIPRAFVGHLSDSATVQFCNCRASSLESLMP